MVFADESPGAGAGPVFVVEPEQRLSRSMLWRLQRSYFERAGVEAWRTSTVPHYATNNPALARAYAAVFLGFLRDCRAAPRDPVEPVTLVELGAGAGRFAYLFLKALGEMSRRSSLADVRYRYVMTDFAEANVAFFRGHDRLRPFVEQGVLDFALFDAEHDREIRLLESGETLSPGRLRRPLGVIANYVFDGLPQDAFSFEGGQMKEWRIALSSSEPEADLADPALLGRLHVAYDQRPAPRDYYGDSELDAILASYAGRREGATILFPFVAMRCLERLGDLAGGRLLLLSGDRGYAHEDSVGELGDPRLLIHGSFSLDVNYHALAAYVCGRGGKALTTTYRHDNLNVSAFLLGEHPTTYAETRLAYEEAVERAGPDDFFSLRRAIQGSYAELGIGPILALIRLGQWDPRLAHDCLPALWSCLEEASEDSKKEIVRALQRVWENYYSTGEVLDFAFELGVLVHAAGGHGEALALLCESRRLCGEDASTSWHMGLCHFARGETAEALQCFADAARIDPSFQPRGAQRVKAGPSSGRGPTAPA